MAETVSTSFGIPSTNTISAYHHLYYRQYRQYRQYHQYLHYHDNPSTRCSRSRSRSQHTHIPQKQNNVVVVVHEQLYCITNDSSSTITKTATTTGLNSRRIRIAALTKQNQRMKTELAAATESQQQQQQPSSSSSSSSSSTTVEQFSDNDTTGSSNSSSASSFRVTLTQDRGNFIYKELQVQLSTGISMQALMCIPKGTTTTTTTTTTPSTITPSSSNSSAKVLLLLHGSFHGAWCWMEHYGPYYAGSTPSSDNRTLGYTVIAPSWRGTGGTYAGPTVKKVKIMEHVNDLDALLQQLPNLLLLLSQQEQTTTDATTTTTTTTFQNPNPKTNTKQNTDTDTKISSIKPIVVAHSFGGLAVMKYLEQLHLKNEHLNKKASEDKPLSSINDNNCDNSYNNNNNNNNNSNNNNNTMQVPFAGIVMMCAVPPSGNGKMTFRFLRRRPYIDSWKITIGFALKQCITSIQLCRELFFDKSISDVQIQQYQQYFQRDSVATIDLLDLAKKLPSSSSVLVRQSEIDDKRKLEVAPFVIPKYKQQEQEQEQEQQEQFPPTAVFGAKYDFIVDYQALEETAQYFGLYQSTTIPMNPSESSLSSSASSLTTSTTSTTTSPVIIIDSPHDVMLGSKWKNGADALLEWIENNIVQ